MIDSNEANAIIIIIKDFNLQLSLPSSLLSQHRSLSSIIKIPIWKDERLEHLDIPKGLIELLHINGFTIEIIFNWTIKNCTNIRNRRLYCTNNI